MPLLIVALLFTPFEVKTELGFRVQHNGANVSLAAIDAAFLKVSKVWREEYNIFVEGAPITVQIVIMPARLWDSGLCLPPVKYAVVNTCDGLCGHTILVNGGLAFAEKQDALWEQAFSLFFQVVTRKLPQTAFLGEGCLR